MLLNLEIFVHWGNASVLMKIEMKRLKNKSIDKGKIILCYIFVRCNNLSISCMHLKQ